MTDLKKKVAVLAEDYYENLEAWYPILRLREAGVIVDVIGRDDGCIECGSKEGYPLKVDFKAKDIDPADYDGVIVPGGYAPDKLRRCENVLKLVRYQAENNGLVAAICHAGWVLASADVIKDVELTSTPAIRDDLVNAGAHWVNEEVVVDGNIITSRAPADLPAFMKAILEFLRNQ